MTLLSLLVLACTPSGPCQGAPMVPAFADADGDGFGDPATEGLVCARGPDEVAQGGDCDDGDADVHPDATEICDGVDNDCDGGIDPDPPTWFADRDGDGHGDPGATVSACTAPAGHVDVGDDCDDDDDDVAPGLVERCNGIDDDCDGQVDTEDPDVDLGTAPTWWPDGDADGWGAGDPVVSCEAPAGHVDNPEDCDDAADDVHPGAPDPCADGIDQDCNGVDGGDGGCMADVCADALTWAPLETGLHRRTIDLGTVTNDLDGLWCTGSTHATGDAFLPLRLAADGGTVRASVTGSDDAYVALVWDCGTICMSGLDALVEGTEELLWENEAHVDQVLQLVVGCAAVDGCGVVDVEVEFVDPDLHADDRCPPAAEPLQTGSYRIEHVVADATDALDVGATCTGHPTGEPDTLVPIVLQPGERVEAALQGSYFRYSGIVGGATSSLYLLDACDPGAGCVAGEALVGDPSVTYTHNGAAPAELTLVAECDLGPYASYYLDYGLDCDHLDLQVVIATP